MQGKDSQARLGRLPKNSPIIRLTIAALRLTLFHVKLDPVLIAYAAKRSAKDKRTVWTRIGAAYPHEQGAGLTILLDALPRDGRIILLERDDEDDVRLSREARRTPASKPRTRR